MNRERGCLGGNSYQKDLSFNTVEFLEKRLKTNKSVFWLDICCGTGKALIEAATHFTNKCSEDESVQNSLRITGIDLAGMFQAFPAKLTHLKLLETSIEDYEPSQKFDLITCVHGLHYIGDKLSVIQKTAEWLNADGMFLANLDLKNLKLIDKSNSTRTFANYFRKQAYTFESQKYLLILKGRRNYELAFDYIGADDKAGSNSTKQPVVNSYYRQKP